MSDYKREEFSLILGAKVVITTHHDGSVHTVLYGPDGWFMDDVWTEDGKFTSQELVDRIVGRNS